MPTPALARCRSRTARPSGAPQGEAASFADDEAGQEAVKAKAYEKLAAHYRFLEGALGDADWYLGRKSFADAYLYVLVRWMEQTPVRLADHPRLAAHRDRMEADAAVRTALARQGMEPQGGDRSDG